MVVAITTAGGVVSIVDSPARQAFVSSLVAPDDLASAISLNGIVMNSARVIGPSVLIVTVGTTPCFAVNAVSYLAVLRALVLIRPLPGAGRGHDKTGGVADVCDALTDIAAA